MQALTFYCDMDGVIANFNREPRALERFKVEKGFFSNLKPIRQNLMAIKMLIKQGRDVRIITTSPNKQADKDKLIWLREYLEELPRDKVILCRPNKSKASYIKDITNAILFDDYGKNCREWRAKGGQAIKIKNNNDILKMVVN